MKDLINQVAEYRFLFESGRNLEVVERFYDEHIIQIENAEQPVAGKEKLMEKERRMLEKVSWLEQRISSLVVDDQDGVVMGEMSIRFDSPQWGKKKLEEAFVQKWKDGKIVHQRFYYSGFLDDQDRKHIASHNT